MIEKLPIIQASLKYSVVHMENSVEADLRVGDILCAVRHGWHVWLRGAHLVTLFDTGQINKQLELTERGITQIRTAPSRSSGKPRSGSAPLVLILIVESRQH